MSQRNMRNAHDAGATTDVKPTAMTLHEIIIV